jgi:L-fuconolactonase
VTEAGGDWSVEQLRPYAAHLIDAFGADRVMFGSDWPVVLLDAGYPEWFAAAQALAADRSEAERQAIFLGTAARFYGISST